MLIDLSDLLIYLLFGLGSGLFVGTAAGTAASFLIPSLTLLAGYSTHQAIGTSLGIDCIIGIVAGITFFKNNYVNLKSAILLVIMGVLGSFIGSLFTSQAQEGVLSSIIGIFLLFIGFQFIRRGVQRNVSLVEKKINFQVFRNHKTITLIILGLIIGGISGFVGIGGSRMLSIILIFVLGYTLHQAIGTSLVMMIFIAGTGAVSHATNGEIMYSGLVIVGFFAAIGAFIGSHFASKINENHLARIVGIIIFMLGSIIILNVFL